MQKASAKTIFLGIVFFLALAGIIPVSDPAYSTDVEMLHEKHLSECREHHVSSFYNNPTEPLLTLANLYSPWCATYIDEYLFFLGLCILLLKILIASTFSDITTAAIYLTLSALFADNYTQTHLFRQIAASYIFLYWLTLRPSRGRVFLSVIALTVHNATTLILWGASYLPKMSRWNKIFLLFLGFSVSAACALVYVLYSNFFTVLYYRYGFAFSNEGITTLGSYVFDLSKYFLLSLVAGVADLHYTGRSHLLRIGGIGLAFISAGIFLPINGELIFRLLVPLKFVILPYYLSLFGIDLIRMLLATRIPTHPLPSPSSNDPPEHRLPDTSTL